MMNVKEKIRVGICGGGPGGGILALTLGKLGGYQVTVLEKGPDLQGGYKIDFRGSAIQVLERLNIYDTVRKNQTSYKAATVTTDSGSVTMEADISGSRSGADLEVMRGLFCQAICNAAESTGNVKYQFSQSIESISEHSNQVQVKLTNGKEQQFDLLVGADGLHSQVRKLVFEKGSPLPKFTHNLGVSICYVETNENLLPKDEEEVEFIGLGRYVAAFNVPGHGTIVSFAFPSETADKSSQRNADALKNLLTEKYGTDRIMWPMMPKILDAVKKAPGKNFHFSEATQVRMPEWSKGRVVLIGDAAACPSPLTGQGGSIAVLSAYILARELFNASGDCGKAYPAYQKSLSEFVVKNQKLADVNIELLKDDQSLKARAIGFAMTHIPPWFAYYIKKILSARIGTAANNLELGNHLPFD